MADANLITLIHAIVAGDEAAATAQVKAQPHLARASLTQGATRERAGDFFMPDILRYRMVGDTALHIAAAAYRVGIIRALLAAGADVRVRNRRGATPLHDAATGVPGSAYWAPAAQAEAIQILIAAGADANALDKGGTAPLHRAVRTRCARAVEALLDGGADPKLKTKSGTTLITLATLATGRSSSGLPEAKIEQAEILHLLEAVV